jgi:hypothetical protein
VDFAIAWVRCGGRAPQQIAAERVEAVDLATGAYAMLTNGGAPLAPGAYQVSVTGGGRIFCAVPFTVRSPSDAAPVADPPAEAAPPAAYAAYSFDGVELSYPSEYGLEPVATGDARGVVLTRAEPFAALFVLARRRGHYDLDRDAAGLLAFLARTVATDGFGAWQKGVVDYDARDLESLAVAGLPARGREFVTRLGTGPSLDFTFYAAEIHGKSAVVGFVTLASSDSAGQDPTADEFYRMVATIRPAGAPAPDLEPRRAPSRARRAPEDVAAVHRRRGSWYS